MAVPLVVAHEECAATTRRFDETCGRCASPVTRILITATYAQPVAFFRIGVGILDLDGVAVLATTAHFGPVTGIVR